VLSGDDIHRVWMAGGYIIDPATHMTYYALLNANAATMLTGMKAAGADFIPYARVHP